MLVDIVGHAIPNGRGDWKRERTGGKMNIIHLEKRQEHNGESIMTLKEPPFVAVPSFPSIQYMIDRTTILYPGLSWHIQRLSHSNANVNT